MARYVRVRKKSYKRKGFTACRPSTHGKTCYHVRAARVGASSFEVRARGARALGLPRHKVIPKLKKGHLGVHFAGSEAGRRKVYASRVHKHGKRHVVAELVALSVLTKRTNPRLSEMAKEDAKWVAGSFTKAGKHVRFPEGYSRPSKHRLERLS